MKKFFKSATFKVLLVIALFLLGIIIYSVASGGSATVGEKLTTAIVTPIQKLGTTISNKAYDFISTFTDAAEIRKQNKKLQEEVNELRQKQIDYDRMKSEYDGLLKYLDMKEENPDTKLAYGKVVAQDDSDYGHFTIDCGSVHGVESGDPVMSAEGLVGRVYKVGYTSCTVRTILDPKLHVTAKISQKNADGSTAGNLKPAGKNQIRLNYLKKEQATTIVKGDNLITAGGGSGVFPPDLLIGSIEYVKPDTDGASYYAVVNLFADISNLDSVVVITNFLGKGDEPK